TLSWTKGKHAFKYGAEFRMSTSDGFSNLNLIPHATGGVGQVALPTFSDSITCPTAPSGTSCLLTTNNTNLGSLLVFQSGSIGNVTQLYFLQHGKSLDKFNDIRTEPNRSRDFRQHEYSFFIKDDWKA